MTQRWHSLWNSLKGTLKYTTSNLYVRQKGEETKEKKIWRNETIIDYIFLAFYLTKKIFLNFLSIFQRKKKHFHSSLLLFIQLEYIRLFSVSPKNISYFAFLWFNFLWYFVECLSIVSVVECNVYWYLFVCIQVLEKYLMEMVVNGELCRIFFKSYALCSGTDCRMQKFWKRNQDYLIDSLIYDKSS